MKNFLLKNKILIAIILVVLGSALFWTKSKNNIGDTIKVTKGEFVKKVSVAGKIVSAESVDLSFDTGGTISNVSKIVGNEVVAGESIASLDSRELVAGREKARADLVAQQAKLDQLKSVSVNDSEVISKKREIIDTISDAYTKADDAVRNKVDQYFKNGTSVYPQIKYTFKDYTDNKDKINEKRLIVEDTLVGWNALINRLTPENYTSNDLSLARKYLATVKDFLDTLSYAVNSFEVTSDLSQATIDKYKSDLGLARSNVSLASSNLVASQEKLRSSVSDIPVLEANVKAAEANVQSFDAQIAKTILKAPFSGIISLQDAKVGQSVAAHEKVTSLISKGFEVESYIPEISIPGVAEKNNAEVSLDAYPNVTFKAIISHIDPAETVKDGVSNYKVKLTFLNNDDRIKSGMTGDVYIETEHRSNVLQAPERSIVSVDGKNYVYKKVEDQSEKKEVVLGEKDGKGNVEIISGINEGEEIVLNPPTN